MRRNRPRGKIAAVESAEFHAMVNLEERHWWYRGRREIIRTQLERLSPAAGSELLDAGCGSGRMMEELDRYARVSGLDSNPEAIALAAARGYESVSLGGVEKMPYRDGSFDLVTCLDVLEHTPDDVQALAELRRVTRPGGHLIVTVPAYRALWSAHDVANHHYRRYGRSALRTAAHAAGWSVVRDSYFNFLLLAPAAVVRLLTRTWSRGRQRSDLALTPSMLNRALEVPLRLEASAMRRGLRLPAGLSLLAVLRNPAGSGRPAAPRFETDPRTWRRRRPAPNGIPRQFVKFALVGVTNTGVSLASYALAVTAGVPYLPASIAAFSLGAVNGYSLNRIWTFWPGEFARSGLLRYAAVLGIGLAANTVMLLALVEGLRADRILAQALVLPLVAVMTFLLNRVWTFRPEPSR